MINYVKGDVLEIDNRSPKFLLHIVNDRNAWGLGFVLALSKKWKEPEIKYRQWAKEDSFKQGNIQEVKVEDNISVINMCAQTLYPKTGIPLSYEALDECLDKVYNLALDRFKEVGPLVEYFLV